MPIIRHRVKEFFCTQDGLDGSSPMENCWKASRTNSAAPEGEQHVTSLGGTCQMHLCQSHHQTMGAGKTSWGNDAAGTLHPKRIPEYSLLEMDTRMDRPSHDT